VANFPSNISAISILFIVLWLSGFDLRKGFTFLLQHAKLGDFAGLGY